MTKRYQFKAKSKYSLEHVWVFGGIAEIEGELYIVSSKVPYAQSRFILADPDTVSQCTGLHDKHGTPIYEGDIWRNVLNPMVDQDPCAIRWDKEYASYYWYDNSGCDLFYDAIAKTGEVIGNVWDNPELIS